VNQKILTPFLDTQTQTIHNQDEIIIDATERPVQRPVYEQQDFFSGKKRDIPLKIS